MMERGKETCRILKEIRRQIALENDIEFVTSECKHKGDCAGTCPKCEAEVRYLEEQLEDRRRRGKVSRVAGLSLGVASVIPALLSSCDVFRTAGEIEPPLEGDIWVDTTECQTTKAPVDIEDIESVEDTAIDHSNNTNN